MFPLSPFAPENLVSRDSFARQFTHGIHHAFLAAVHTFTPSTAIGSVPIIVYRVTQLLTDGVHFRDSAGAGPVVLKILPVTGAAFSGFTMDHFFG